MSQSVLLVLICSYLVVLFVISYFTAHQGGDNKSFFLANRRSKWYVIAFGMIGTTLSGVTFISVPGKVGVSGFSYYAFVLGNGLGFLVVNFILMPLYYKLELSSIYKYIGLRFGLFAQKVASVLFLLSRTIGSAARLYLVGIILQKFVFEKWGIPFELTILICLLTIWGYTVRGGLKTIIWTDSIQTIFLLVAVCLSIYFIVKDLQLGDKNVVKVLMDSDLTTMFFSSDFLLSGKHFLKLFVGGFFVTIAMVGLDQDLMQKNLSLPSLKEAQKNMMVFVVIFLIVNLLFLVVGALLKIYWDAHLGGGVLDKTDYLYPTIALNHLSVVGGVIFMLGLIAATFSTTDSAITALTTSFCLDILNFKEGVEERVLEKKRKLVHSGFSVLIFFVCVVLYYFNNDAVVDVIFIVASYTYAPLLAIYIWGLYTTYKINERYLVVVSIVSPLVCYGIAKGLKVWGVYVFSFEVIVLNTVICLLGLGLISKKKV